eukprot:TRINITY_DN1051_c0_g1_i1.p1 TRINITY_DN1051_c0_g1~~TRINITY_DN1051_c0_g1_i1.p1  ORF type:complete len:339 (-),score=57.90 TRINITY_DN1051_c0_g1_i1:49-1065(-)
MHKRYTYDSWFNLFMKHTIKNIPDHYIYNNQSEEQVESTRAFFANLAKTRYELYQDIDFKGLIYPIKPEAHVDKLAVVKVFASKAKPVLIKTSGQFFDHLMIFKKGDDLRQDFFIQTMFALFNLIWEVDSSLELNPFLYLYKVVPVTQTCGCIEFVRGCNSTEEFNWREFSNMEEDDKECMMLSMAASYMVAWILGIRDRHQDNMQVKDGKIFFQIDFGHIFNEGPLLDARRLSYNPKMIKYISNEDWQTFVKISTDCFMSLRNESDLIISICLRLFSNIRPAEDMYKIRKFLVSKNSLMLTSSDTDARKTIANEIKSCRKSFKTVLKYKAHEFASSS